MASPQAPAPPTSAPPSYADRAKKAQNGAIRTPAHDFPSVTADLPALIAKLPSGTAPAAPAASSSSVGDTLADTTNTSANSPMDDTTAKTAPAVNVWAIRKEQMAQVRAQSQPPQPNAIAPLVAAPMHAHGGSTSSKVNGGTESLPDAFTARYSHVAAPPPPVVDTNRWPQVGELTASTPGFATPHSSNGDGGERKEDGGSGSVNGTSRRGEKPKWVPIPAGELQAAADAVRAKQHSTSRSGQRHGSHSSASRGPGSSTHAPPPIAASSSSGSNSRAPPGMSRTNSSSASPSLSRHSTKPPSVAASASQSRSGSVQSSPRPPARGRRLPGEDLPARGPGGGPGAYANVGPGALGLDATGTSRRSSTGSGQAPVLGQPQQPYLDIAQGQAQGVPYFGGYGPGPSPVGVNGGAPQMYYPPPGAPYFSPPPPMQMQHAQSQGGLSLPQQHPHGHPHPYGMNTGSPLRHSYSLPGYGGGAESPGGYAGQGGASGQSPGPAYAMPPWYGYGIPPPYMHWMPGMPSGERQQQPMLPPHAHPQQPQPLYTLPPVPGALSASASTTSSFLSPSPSQNVTATAPPSTHVNGTGASVGVPPRSAMERPPPPALSRAVAGYREIGPVATPVLHAASPVTSPGAVPAHSHGPGRAVLFGSVAFGATSPSPVGSPTLRAGADDDTDGLERAFRTIAIGIEPGEEGPSRARSKTRPQESATEEARVESAVKDGAQLSESGRRWQFGTTERPEVEDALALASDVHGGPALPPEPASSITTTAPWAVAPAVDSSAVVTSGVPPENDFEVRDFGYGFGAASGTGYAAMDGRERERARVPRDMGGYAGAAGPGAAGGIPPSAGRPRRGSYTGYDRGTYSPRRAGGRGYGGRGAYGSGGRGYARGGGYGPRQAQPYKVTPPSHATALPPVPVGVGAEGYYAPVTTYGQPAYDAYYPAVSPQAILPQPPPPVPQAGAAPAVVPPPVPMPLSVLSFPLDPTRYYLLGQLEYYLSTQNLAQDFFLRQQMDSRGWIPISLIASFPRVRQLTTDETLVHDVLTLSSLAEVRLNWVRASGSQWRSFVLPDAKATIVPGEEADPPSASASQSQDFRYSVEAGASPSGDDQGRPLSGESADEAEGEDEDDEDVEFVVGPDAVRAWTPTATAAVTTSTRIA